MIFPITAPGIYPGITNEQYHADPCAEISLNSSIAKLLIQRSPRHAYLAHARLGGATDEEEIDDSSKAKDLGTLIHSLAIGGAEVVVIEADSYRSGLAKAQRDSAKASGKIPVLAHKLPEAQSAAAAARQQLDDMGYTDAYRKGMNEVVIVWEEEGGIWLRAMLDNLYINENTRTAVIRDLKTVGRSSHPEACAKQIGDMGYDLSLAFYMRGLVALRPDLAGRIKSSWDFLEVVPPYALTPVEISAEWQLAAEFRCEKAIALWRKCRAENKWPYYVEQLTRLEPRPWMIADAFLTE